jgi:hypothetical protein
MFRRKEVVSMVAQDVPVGKSSLLNDGLADLDQLVRQSVQEGKTFDDFERQLWQKMLKLGNEAVGQFLAGQGTGDLGETATLTDGCVVRRLADRHSREFTCVFGTFVIERTVYGSREGQKLELVPVDTRLALPDAKFSYLLQDWNQFLATEAPFAKVATGLERILDLRQHVDSLETGSRHLAASVAAFRQAQTPPPAKEEGAIVVRSGDGKGVPIRRAEDVSIIQRHRSQRGPKPDRKRMATVGTVYTVDRYVRTADQIVEALFQKPDEKGESAVAPRPRPCHKRVRATLDHVDADGNDCKGIAETFGWMAEQVAARNPAGFKPIVNVMDGQESLWNALDVFEPRRDDQVDVLDLLHVTQRLWQAAHLFFPARDANVEPFLRERLLGILQGQAGRVVGGLRQMATKRRLPAVKRRQLEKIAAYFQANLSRMRYDQYLAAGYPIASGAIEGACRHLVKDRLERTGMSWTKTGAQAMLDQRATAINGDWDSYIQFRTARETKRLHPHRSIVTQHPWPLAA